MIALAPVNYAWKVRLTHQGRHMQSGRNFRRQLVINLNENIIAL